MTKPTIDERIEQAVGELAAALYVKCQEDPKAGFHCAGAAVSIITGMRMDLIKTGRVKYSDL